MPRCQVQRVMNGWWSVLAALLGSFGLAVAGNALSAEILGRPTLPPRALVAGVRACSSLTSRSLTGYSWLVRALVGDTPRVVREREVKSVQNRRAYTRP